MTTPAERDGMTAPDLATQLRLIADCKVFACVGDEQTVRDAADLLTRHQAERETLRAQIESIRDKLALLISKGDITFVDSSPWRVYAAPLLKQLQRDVLALLAKGETP